MFAPWIKKAGALCSEITPAVNVSPGGMDPCELRLAKGDLVGRYYERIADHGVNTLFTAPTAFRAIKKEDPRGEFLAGFGLDVEPFDVWAAQNLNRFGALDHHDPFDRMILSQAAVVPGTTNRRTPSATARSWPYSITRFWLKKPKVCFDGVAVRPIRCASKYSSTWRHSP